jgi:glutaredoxin
MKPILIFITLLFCTLSLPAVYAVTVLECVDEAGNSTFQDHCPPGTTPASQRDIKTGAPDATADTSAKKPEPTPGTGNATITFYTTSMECDACMVIKSVLSKYGASFTEKDISTDLAVRQELRDKTGATGTTVSVPTVIINDQVITGFNKEAVAKALEDAGYKKPESAAAPAPVAK